MVFIARFPSPNCSTSTCRWDGGCRCTADISGRAYLSALPAAAARRILTVPRPAAHTSQTLTDLQQIWKRIDSARESGYAWSDQEYYRGDVTIAAPVLGEDGQPLAACSLSVLCCSFFSLPLSLPPPPPPSSPSSAPPPPPPPPPRPFLLLPPSPSSSSSAPSVRAYEPLDLGTAAREALPATAAERPGRLSLGHTRRAGPRVAR